MNIYLVIGSAIVGLLVGLTGAGGGALMTPMLVLLFSVKPGTAISSDLVASVVMRPVGAGVHFQRGTVNLRLAGWMSLGSVPSAFAGTYVAHLLGQTATATRDLEMALGGALLLGAAAMLLRHFLDHRSARVRDGSIRQVSLRPFATIVIGIVGGLLVGITSVGAGSLMIVLLMFLYPKLSANQLVGTDLAQAMPLTAAAAVGALVFGHVAFPVTVSIIVGSVPAVLIGSLLSSRVQDRFIRPAITFVVFASGLKYVGVGTRQLGLTLLGVVLAIAMFGFVRSRLLRSRILPTNGERLQSITSDSSVGALAELRE